jgi:NDP-sugar pyrophosphorylase family protein
MIETPLHYGVIKIKDNIVLDIEEKPTLNHEINAGIYFLSPSVLPLIPENEHFTMVDLIRLLMDNKRKVCAFRLKDYWLDIGQMKDYEQAKIDLDTGLIK